MDMQESAAKTSHSPLFSCIIGHGECCYYIQLFVCSSMFLLYFRAD